MQIPGALEARLNLQTPRRGPEFSRNFRARGFPAARRGMYLGKLLGAGELCGLGEYCDCRFFVCRPRGKFNSADLRGLGFYYCCGVFCLLYFFFVISNGLEQFALLKFMGVVLLAPEIKLMRGIFVNFVAG